MAKMKSSTIMHDDRITHITHVTACWVHHATVRTRRGRIQRQRMHPHKVATSRRGAPPPALRRPPEPPRGVPRPHRRRRGRGAVQLHVEVGPAARVQHERRHGHALAALDGRDAGVEAVRVADGRGEGDEGATECGEQALVHGPSGHLDDVVHLVHDHIPARGRGVWHRHRDNAARSRCVSSVRGMNAGQSWQLGGPTGSLPAPSAGRPGSSLQPVDTLPQNHKAKAAAFASTVTADRSCRLDLL